MEIFIWVMIGIAAIAGIDRIFGNRIGLGEELEKAVSMIAPLALSMAGILVLAPSISHLLQNVSGYFPEFLDFSVIPSLIFANDMGGAHLAHDLAKDEAMGYFNGLVTASMMGATVSFTIPFSTLRYDHYTCRTSGCRTYFRTCRYNASSESYSSYCACCCYRRRHNKV